MIAEILLFFAMPIVNLPSAHLRLYRFLALLILLTLGILCRYFWFTQAPLLAHTSAYAFALLILFPLCLLPKLRVAAILCACFCMGLWRADMVLPKSESAFSCAGTWQIQNFPSRNIPLGQRLPLRLIEGDCPALRGQWVIASHFSPELMLQISDSFSASLSIRSGKQALYATLPKALTKTTHPAPLIVRYRAALAQRIDALFPHERAWVRALIIGERNLLSSYERDDLQRTGTSHLLAISGLHLAVMMGVFYWIAKLSAIFTRLRYLIEPHSFALCAALMAGLGFALISGAQAPILRAWLMFACLCLMWLNLPLQSGLIALCCALWIILFIDPLALFSLSAWLSFLATAAVIIIMRRIKQRAMWQQWLILQTGINIALLPIVWGAFGGISLISVVVNLIVVPWLGLILCALLAALALPSLAPIANTLLIAYLRPITLSAQLPFAYIEPHYQPPLIAAGIASIALLCLYAKRTRAFYLLILIAILSALPTFFDKTPYHLPNKRLPSIIIYPPNAAPIIINTGYRYRERNDAKRYLLPHLRQRFARPQAIIITKDSRYATGGIATLLSAYPNTPIYTLVNIPELTFSHQYCPELPEETGMRFTQGQECQLTIGEQTFSPKSLKTTNTD